MFGQAKQLNWEETSQEWSTFWIQPRYSCEAYAYCGSFSSCSVSDQNVFCQCLQGFRPSDSFKQLNPSSGCVRRTTLRCKDSSSVNGDEDNFLMMNNVKFPFSAKESKLQDTGECKLACFNDCPCTAYAYNEGAGCSLCHGELFNLRQLLKDDPDGQTMYLKLAASEFQIPRGKKLV
ncbi:hypothetical protein LWI29_003048 [Acer saccharum]|uniref:Apple domain-containing protein n=1 Tax=Acer saccharum TaxID=4024 RepID=A0AA39W0Q8_ACESA|nr:hypothetical protein LWI29_003048 [Acer saccharum]